MQRYFLEPSHFYSDYVMITGEEQKHIRRVMRMETGDTIVCCALDGKCYTCELSEFTDEHVKAVIVEEETVTKELPIEVSIAHGLPKGDKLELVLQKGTELGAFHFLPFEAERSIVKWDEKKAKKKIERWNKITKEAAEQSHRQKMPKVHSVDRFQNLVYTFKNYTYVLVAYEEAAKSDEKSRFFSVLNNMKAGDNLLLLIGPEGGFSDREIQTMQEHGAITCGFGPRILRSETAPLYGLAAISYHFELLG
ncbi:16S rRNA (uracil(1498)-N(3))-methyltransferase [Bacillus shivajii]|uniref:16S rRNA (uracil(1498)-N(3))-methyltransferase n=1 Tax=Bacillus shivajii TaxID=1983719 RepID=UPI001CFC4679|nr:16S rRNA (uracil(1498)-N(3))-methyltransferase [Bacillus shivajii]UCZ54489.1 16S rRNA (uracil(1498)-N(3))-methyltransferase [Bacillus shivajii]